jgi:hypothetical protein
MNRFVLTTAMSIALVSLVGCINGAPNPADLSQQQSANGYCHKKLQPMGPTDAAKTNQSRAGDYIDYYGPCSGPSTADQIRQQKRFEQFRFGRDYMDEG